MISGRFRVVGLTTAWMICLSFSTHSAPLSPPVPDVPPSLVFVERTDGVPPWATHFGSEFWHQPVTPCAEPTSNSTSVEFLEHVRVGNAIERVSHAFTPARNGSAALVQAQTYQATVQAHGLEFAPEVPAGPLSSNSYAPEAKARFRTRSIHLDGQDLIDSNNRLGSWYITGNTAQALLDPQTGLTEFYEASRDGIEVTWLLPRRLSQSGDLVIRAELAGFFTTRETPSGLHFADSQGTERIKVARVIAMDSRGHIWPASMVGSGESLKITVPENTLANATFPLAIDPLISPEFGVDQPVETHYRCVRTTPAIAANSAGYLIVWAQGKGTNTDPAVYAARLTPGGDLLDPAGILVSTNAAEQTVCAVAANGRTFLAVWATLRPGSTTDWDVLGARVQSDGTVLDTVPLPICTAGGTLQNSPAVAGNGDSFLVVWRDSRATGINGILVRMDGAFSPTNIFAVSGAANDQYLPAVTALGTNYLVAWQDYRVSNATQYNSRIFAARITGDGTLLDTNGIAVSSRPGSQFNPAVAANGTNFLVVWEDYDIGGNDIYGARLSPAGVLLDTNALLIVHAPGTQSEPAVADTLDGNFLVAWQDFRGSAPGNFEAKIFAARVHPDGSVADPGGFPLSSESGEQWRPAIAAHQGQLLVVWQDLRNYTNDVMSDIYGVRITGNHHLVLHPVDRIGVNANAELTPAVAANGTNFLVVWADTRNLLTNGTDIYGVRLGPDGSLLDPVAVPICTATNNQTDPAVAANGANYLVVWTDFRRTPTNVARGDIYGTIVSPDGVVLQPDGIPIRTTPNDQALPAVAPLGTNFLVVWQDSINGWDIYATRVDGLGNVLDPTAIAIAPVTNNQTSPTVAGNLSAALVVWADTRADAVNTHIYGARLAPDGTVLDTNGFPICTLSGSQTAPAVATDGNGFLIAWVDNRNSTGFAPDIYGTLVGSDGTLSPSNGIPIRAATGPQTIPTIAFDGTAYLVAWQEARTNNAATFNIFGTRVGVDGSVLSDFLLPIDASGYNHLVPAAAASGDGRMLVVNQAINSSGRRVTANLVNLAAIPHLDSATHGLGGEFQFRFHGALGERYALEVSGDLKTWISVGTFTNTLDPAWFSDATAAQPGARFYRAVLLP